jgi:hypothetical protein
MRYACMSLHECSLSFKKTIFVDRMCYSGRMFMKRGILLSLKAFKIIIWLN